MLSDEMKLGDKYAVDMSKRLIRRICFSGGIMLLVLCQLNFPWVEDTEVVPTGEDPVKGNGTLGIAQDPWQWSSTQNWENGERETLIRSARACEHPSMQIDVASNDEFGTARYDLGAGDCEAVGVGGRISGYGIWGVLMFSFGSSFLGYIGGRRAIRASRFIVALGAIAILIWWYTSFPFMQEYPEVDPLGDGRTLFLDMEIAEGFWMACAGTGLILLNVLLMGPRKRRVVDDEDW